MSVDLHSRQEDFERMCEKISRIIEQAVTQSCAEDNTYEGIDKKTIEFLIAKPLALIESLYDEISDH
jgi:hypothetical protein